MKSQVIWKSKGWIAPTKFAYCQGIVIGRPTWDVYTVYRTGNPDGPLNGWMIYRAKNAEARHQDLPVWDSAFSSEEPTFCPVGGWCLVTSLQHRSGRNVWDAFDSFLLGACLTGHGKAWELAHKNGASKKEVVTQQS